MARGIVDLLRDRLRKRRLYDTPGYWDMKAREYHGLARSAWPSNAYNAALHARQMAIIDEVLGEVRGRSVVDVGCGTGRAALHLARRGARVTGLDFSTEALAAARREAEQEGLAAEFLRADVRAGFEPALGGRFDAVLVLGCLTLACRDAEELGTALRQIASLARPGARLLFVEPIHEARLTARVLRAPVGTWLDRAHQAGLELQGRRGLLFVPTRYLLAFRDLPEGIVTRVFAAGERALGALGEPDLLSDYKAIWFEKRAGA